MTPVPIPRLSLRLYVAGKAPNSLIAIANATTICDEHYPEAYEIDVVDLLAQPARALADGIVVTPTLLILAPAPPRRVIGNLSDKSQVLLILGAG